MVIRKYMFFLTIFLGLLIFIGNADAKSKYPKGCSDKSITYSDNDVVLGIVPGTDLYRVFVFKNTSRHILWLTYIHEHESVVRPTASKISPNHYSAIMVPDKKFKVTCSENISNELYTVNCQEVLQSCEMRIAKLDPWAHGTYWVTQNVGSVGSLFRGLRAQNVYP